MRSVMRVFHGSLRATVGLAAAMLLLLTVGGAVVAQDAAEETDVPLPTPIETEAPSADDAAAPDDAAPPEPAAEPEPEPEPASTLPEVVATSEQAAVLQRINRALAEPDAGLSPAQLRERLDALIADADRLASITEPGPLHLHALSIEMQSIYQRIVRFPGSTAIDRDLGRLRAAARRVKALDPAVAPDAASIGDFWLMTADLYDINRLQLPAEARRAQTRQLLQAHLREHGEGPTAGATRQALRRLEASEPDPQTPTPDRPADPEHAANPDMPKPPGAAGNPVTGGANQAVDLDAEDPVARTRAALARLNDPAFEVGVKQADPKTGVITVPIRSRYQAGVNPLRIIEPAQMPDAGEPLTVLLVLPVEAGMGGQWGDGLQIVRELGTANDRNVLVVSPSFSALPWYGDHPTRPDLWQESYMVHAVVPAIQQMYPADRYRFLLLGFSKSGWGALSLLLRWPQVFDAAAAWDAPLMIDDVTKYGTEEVFANNRTFERYTLPKKFRDQARLFRKSNRIALLGFDVFREHHQRAHALLDQLQIPHHYVDGPQTRHRWDAAWVKPAIDLLLDHATGPAQPAAPLGPAPAPSTEDPQ